MAGHSCPATSADHRRAPGDSITRYEEYRGFMVQDAHTRTSPDQKDYFAVDATSFGDLGSFPGGGMPVCHRLKTSEYQGRYRADPDEEMAPNGV